MPQLPVAALTAGDLSYAVGYAGEWEEWMAQIEPYAARAPFMVQVGNHERNWNGGHARAPTRSGGMFDWGSLNATSSGGVLHGVR